MIERGRLGELDVLHVRNAAATATVALQGAHLCSYGRSGEAPLLWLSPEARFEQGRAIRGGVPVCWPWFGNDPRYPDAPQHGFARVARWEIESVDEPDERLTRIVLVTDETMHAQPWFPFSYRLRLSIDIGDGLSLTLHTENTDTRPFSITEALHTYLRVGDITRSVLHGLENAPYADALDGFRLKQESRALHFGAETDRVYDDAGASLTLRDEALKRRIRIEKRHSRSTVVWNPWHDKAARLSDFPDDGYRTMLCIETANALRHMPALAPGHDHKLVQILHVTA